MTLCWISTSTHKHHIISIQYPSHKCLPEKSYPDFLRILIRSWLFKDPVVIMKEIMSFPIVIMAWLSTMLNQTVKNGLKRPNCPKGIFRADPELWGCVISGLKMAHLSWTKFFWYKPLLLLSSTYLPFWFCLI